MSRFAFLFHSIVLLSSSEVVSASPLKVFILAGESNMIGHGSMDDLERLIVGGDKCSNEYREMVWNETHEDYKVANRVYVKHGDSKGKLSLNSNGGSFDVTPDTFGPEYMFGMTVGKALNNDENILLIKSAWGGKSLAVDFRPPSGGTGNYSDRRPIQYGRYYRMMITEILAALSSLANQIVIPYDETEGYELAGFAWFQGWSDVLSWDKVNEYETLLKLFIKDVRSDLQAPNLPFVVGELGVYGRSNLPEYAADQILAMRAAQEAVTLTKQYEDNSIFVPTAEFAHSKSDGPIFEDAEHYYGRADTFLHIGKALGKGALKFVLGTETETTDGDAVLCDEGEEYGPGEDVARKKKNKVVIKEEEEEEADGSGVLEEIFDTVADEENGGYEPNPEEEVADGDVLEEEGDAEPEIDKFEKNSTKRKRKRAEDRFAEKDRLRASAAQSAGGAESETAQDIGDERQSEETLREDSEEADEGAGYHSGGGLADEPLLDAIDGDGSFTTRGRPEVEGNDGAIPEGWGGNNIHDRHHWRFRDHEASIADEDGEDFSGGGQLEEQEESEDGDVPEGWEGYLIDSAHHWVFSGQTEGEEEDKPKRKKKAEQVDEDKQKQGRARSDKQIFNRKQPKVYEDLSYENDNVRRPHVRSRQGN